MFVGDGDRAVKAYCARWQAFITWRRSEKWQSIIDTRQIDRKVLVNYAPHLRDIVRRSKVAVSTA